MKHKFALLIISVLVLATAGYADETTQAQAMQFGMMFGGVASQYDECVRKGLIPHGPQSATDEADMFIKTSDQFTHDKESSEYVLKGWDIARQNIDRQSPEYWKNNCDRIAQQWAKFETLIQRSSKP